MKNKTDKSTEEKILDAAHRIFTQKGFAATRMQFVADEASINKSLLHYYFRSKDKLFHAVMIDAMQNVFQSVNSIFESDLPLFDKIEQFVSFYIDHISKHPYLPAFVINEINREPNYVVNFISQLKPKPNPEKLFSQIKSEIKNGSIKPTDPKQFFINMMSLCVFPFIAKAMIQNMLHINDKAYAAIIEQRKKDVSKFIIDSIKK